MIFRRGRKVISALLMGIVLSVFCAFPAFATDQASVPAVPPSKAIKIGHGSITKRFQITNDLAHKQIIMKDLDTGVTQYLSPATKSGGVKPMDVNPPVPSGWTQYDYVPSSDNSYWDTFAGNVTMLVSTNPVDNNGDYDIALEMNSSIEGTYHYLGSGTIGYAESGVQDFQWAVSVNDPNTTVIQGVPNTGIQYTNGSQQSFTLNIPNLGGFNDTWSPAKTQLNTVWSNNNYQTDWTDNQGGGWPNNCILYPVGVPLQAVVVYHWPSQDTSAYWNWNWTWTTYDF